MCGSSAPRAGTQPYTTGEGSGAGSLDSLRDIPSLDRVLHGEVAEAFVAADGGCQPEKGQIVARVSLVAVVESAVAGQPRHRPLDDPPSAAQPFAGVDTFAGDADADALTAEPFPQVRDVVRLVGVAVGAWTRPRGIRVPCGNGTASASAPGCRGCWPRRVRRVGAVRPRPTGHASWNLAYPGPRGSDLQVRPLFSADMSRVEDGPGEVDQVPFVQELETV